MRSSSRRTTRDPANGGGSGASGRIRPSTSPPVLRPPIGAICFDWGGTLMSEDGPPGVPMCLWPEVAVIPGAMECLTALSGGAPLCIATNAADSRRPMIELALDRTGLLRFFSHIFCFTEIGYRKSEPEFWRAVQQRLDLPLDQVVMVGDSLEHDVLAPQRCGLQGVWFNAKGEHQPSPAPVTEVSNLAQLATLVREATASDPVIRTSGR